MTDVEKQGEPLPIWFFVGVILVVYGGLVMLSDLIPAGRAVVLAELHAPIWWGAITLMCGAIFLVIGIRQHRVANRAVSKP